jgi:hypothetical protein
MERLWLDMCKRLEEWFATLAYTKKKWKKLNLLL